MKLADYIEQNYDSNAAFGRAQSVDRQVVYRWIKNGWIVVDQKLYSPQREIKKD